MSTKRKRLKRIGAALCAALILITLAVIPISASAETSAPLSVEDPISNNPYYDNVDSGKFVSLYTDNLTWSWDNSQRIFTLEMRDDDIYDFFGSYIQYSDNYCNVSIKFYSATHNQFFTISTPYLDVKTLYYMGSSSITFGDDIYLETSSSGRYFFTIYADQDVYGTLAGTSTVTATFTVYKNPYQQGYARAQTWYEEYITQAEQTYLANILELQNTINALRETQEQNLIIPNIVNGFLRGIAEVIETFDGVELFGFTGQEMITYALTVLVLVVFVKLVVFII